ncbi:signal peptidase I [Sinomonas sp. RB5]
MRNLLRRLLAVAATAAAVSGALLGVLLVSGQAAVVVTHGVSMNPVYYQGDLIALTRADAYQVGDIVAYHVHGGPEIALHRIIGGDAAGFTIKGDNNQSTDIDHPTAEQIIGRAVVHLPQAGTVLKALTSPPVLALAAFALLGGGATALTRRRRRRTRRRTSMSRHLETGTPSRHKVLGQLLQRPLRPWTATAAAALALSGSLGAWAWSGPTETGTSTGGAAPGRSMDFSYSAPVRPSAAYDGTTVSSPDPVFRKVLAGDVTVGYTYHGPAGTVSVAAELSAPGGWHATVPLTGAQPISDGATGKAALDLAALEGRAQAAAQATGTPATPLTVAVVPTVRAGGADYSPALRLTLAPLQLSLADTAGLSTGQKAAAPAAKERSLTLGAWSLGAGAARPLSAGAFGAAALALAGLALAARRRGPQDEAARIRHRLGSLLVPVHPVPAPPGRAVVDVADIATLARLAERYGLLILTWTRSNVETFIVNDENITYRYRTGAAEAPQPEHGAGERAEGTQTLQ